MGNAIDMMEAFQMHYTPNDGGRLKYNDAQRVAITRLVGDVPEPYLAELFNNVVATHESRFRSLPDVAIINKAMASMDAPETYLPPPLLLEEPIPVIQEIVEQIRKSENGNEFERRRVRNRVSKNDATRYEAWWIHVIDDLGGKWEVMPEGYKA